MGCKSSLFITYKGRVKMLNHSVAKSNLNFYKHKIALALFGDHVYLMRVKSGGGSLTRSHLRGVKSDLKSPSHNLMTVLWLPTLPSFVSLLTASFTSAVWGKLECWVKMCVVVTLIQAKECFLVFNIKHCRVLQMSNVWNTTNLLGTVVSTNIFISVNKDF